MQQAINADQLPTAKKPHITEFSFRLYLNRYIITTNHHVTVCISEIPCLEHRGPQALSSAGPYPSEPPLRRESGMTPHHLDYPTLVHGGRLEVWVLLLKVETMH